MQKDIVLSNLLLVLCIKRKSN